MVPMEVVWPMRCREGGLCLAIFALVLFALSPMAPAADATQKNFASPEDGIAALVETVKLNEQAKLDAILEYASKFVSTPGKHDGLYWETQLDEPPSPLGPLLVVATSEGYGSSDSQPLAPYHGYFYRILTKQGKDAQGGAYDYLIDGKMIGGFGVIAYPARYGASGIMSFIVNQDGVVYQKDLGKDTAAIAAQIAIFNPDASWKRP